MQVAISSELNICMEYTWFAGKGIQCGPSILCVLRHGDLLAE